VASSSSAIVAQAGSVNKALKLNGAAMNLARLTGKSCATSQRLIATAEAGTPGRLSRNRRADHPSDEVHGWCDVERACDDRSRWREQSRR
jgi:hypothetical protein